MINEIEILYTNPAKFGSFAGVSSFMQNNKLSNLKAVKDSLSRLESYSMFKNTRKRFRRRPVLVFFPNYQFCADLAVTTNFETSKLKNKYQRTNYLLVVVDQFTKAVYLEPCKSKTNKNVVQAFTKIFQRTKPPKFLQTDDGTEFTGGETQNFFKDLNITQFSTSSPVKASHCERKIRDVKMRIARFLYKHKDKSWTDAIGFIENQMNNSKSKIHGFIPLKINKTNEHKVWQKLYSKYLYQKPEKPVFKIGDEVRISNKRLTFDKESIVHWTSEIFVISEVRDFNPIVYKLKDKNEQPIEGTFYKFDLQKVG